MARVQLQEVDFRYPGSAAHTLEHLDLDIADGEAHALLGGSGAGKTTLLNLLSGLLQPTSGQLLLAGDSMSATVPAKRGVAQVFQFPVLYEALSLLDNLGFPLRTQGIRKTDRDQRAQAVAQKLDFQGNGLDNLASRKPASLSLYQKQLLAIGKALVRPDIKLVLLDEPLTAVQPSLKWALRRTLKQVQRELGVTMIYVTHDQTEALTFADRVSVLHNGGILQCDTPEQLYLQPAHPYVGFFIGSPGMNFLQAQLQNGRVTHDAGSWPVAAAGGVALPDGPIQIGFRPEWATTCSRDVQSRAPSFNGTIAEVRTTGLAAGKRTGLMQIDLAGASNAGASWAQAQRLQVGGALQHSPGDLIRVQLSRFLLYRQEQLVATVADTGVPA
ncbi:MAG: ABC transporter ATP-binding protein [Pseudomonadales bacterium]